MNWQHILFGYRGSISRIEMWRALVVLAAFCVLAWVIVLFATGSDQSLLKMQAHGSSEDVWDPRVEYWQASLEYARNESLAMSIIMLLVFWPLTAILVKRLHDRNQRGFWAFLFWGSFLLFQGAYSCGLWSIDEEGAAIGFMMIHVAEVTFFYSLPGFILGIWFFIELGFFPGKTDSEKWI